MQKRKLYEKVTKNMTNGAIGIFIALVAVFAALSTAETNDNFIYVGKFVHWCVSFLVGSIFAYIFYVIALLYGISLIFSYRPKIKTMMKYTIIGLVLIFIGSIILIANAFSYKPDADSYLTFNNYGQYFNEHIISTFPNVDTFANGGVIGLSLVALINSGMTYIGSNVIGSVLLVLGTFFAFAKITLQFVNYLAAYWDKMKARRQRIHYDEYDSASNIKFTTTGTPKKQLIKEDEKIEEEKVEPRRPLENSYDNKFVLDSDKKPFVEEPIRNEPVSIIEPPAAPISSTNIAEEPRVETQVNPRSEQQYAQEPRAYQQERLINPTNGLQRAYFDPAGVEPKDSGEREAIKPQPTVDATQASNYARLQQEYLARQQAQQNQFAASSQNSYQSQPVQEQPKVEPQVQVSERNEFTERKEPQPSINTFVKPEPIQPVKQEEPKEEQVETVPQPQIRKKKKIKFKNVDSNLLEVRDTQANDDENLQTSYTRQGQINVIFQDLGIKANVVSFKIGPSVTRFDVKPDKTISINSLVKNMDDVFQRVGGVRGRFMPIIEGMTTGGIELPNAKRNMVNFKDCLEALEDSGQNKLNVTFGKNINGDFVSGDLCDFPHLLVAGTTGSGKSIFMHSLIMSLIMRNSPDKLKLFMVDPKKVEFAKYKEIPHLLCPIITEPGKAYMGLIKLSKEMDERYDIFERVGVSNIKQYNEEAEDNGLEKMPYIVVIIDEFADLMDTNRKCQEPVSRLGQKARACGIHMIIATQRPSVDVITGVIKGNIASRVALSCASYTDSATILGEGGAEKLLGNGDMLLSIPSISRSDKLRVQGCFVSNKEIKAVCTYLRENYDVDYDQKFLDLEERTESQVSVEEAQAEKDQANEERYQEIKFWVMEYDYCSISKIQNEFQLGFPKASKYFKRLEAEGIISNQNEPNNAKGRMVLKHNLEASSNEPQQAIRGGSIEQSTMDYSKKM